MSDSIVFSQVLIDHLRNRLNFDLNKSRQKQYKYSITHAFVKYVILAIEPRFPYGPFPL